MSRVNPPVNANLTTYVGGPIVDKDGHPTVQWQSFFDQIIQYLNNNLSNSGHVVPSQPTLNINQTAPNGNLILDTTTNQLKIMINGVYKIVTVT